VALIPSAGRGASAASERPLSAVDRKTFARLAARQITSFGARCSWPFPGSSILESRSETCPKRGVEAAQLSGQYRLRACGGEAQHLQGSNCKGDRVGSHADPRLSLKASMEARFKEPRLLPAAYLSTTGRSQGIGESTTTQRKHGPSEGQESPAWDRVDHVVCPTDFCFSL
jgi:hypothetical protein